MKRSSLLFASVALACATSVNLLHAQNTPPAGAQPGAPAAPGGGFGGGPGGPGGPGGGGRGGFGGGGGRGGGGRGVAGPPAPVPEAVRIPHPTTQEITEVNAELAKLITSDSSAVKPVLEKYQSLIKLDPTPDNPCIRPTSGGVRTPRHDAFVERAKQGGIDLLFHGDSITDWWQSDPPQGGKAVMEKYFGQYKMADFAVAGDTTQGVLWGLQNGEATGYQPKAIMLMIGTNSTGGQSGAQIAEGVGADIYEMRKDFPDAKILLLAIFPRGTPTDPNRVKIAEANKIIQKLDDGQHVFYMDIGSKFLDDKGAFLPDTFRGDNLHPVEKGYEIWANAVKDKIADLMK